ncbi:hypothetical protein RUM43_012550 [Polyplax serrata]|uniref:Uncharacterized protein n=1 Tax=Polyplax serrata TaxID=468196 RepID=A0AAN8NXG2_POLSC
MATPDYEETEVQDLLQLPPASGIIKQGNCFPSGVLKTSNSSKNQLSVTILDFVQSSYSDNEDQKSFLSNLSTSGTDCVVNASNSDERRGSGGSQKEGFFSTGSLPTFVVQPSSGRVQSSAADPGQQDIGQFPEIKEAEW